MKRLFNIKKAFVLIVAMIIVVGLVGCSKKTSSMANPGNEDKNTDNVSQTLTRSEFIGILGKNFGLENYVSENGIFTDVRETDPNYGAIQAASEWGVIPESKDFGPSEPATLQFALESAVRAVGLEDIQASGASVNESNLVDFYASNIANIDTTDTSLTINANVAEQIVQMAVTYRDSLVLPQTVNITVAEGVKPAELGISLSADNMSGTFGGSESYAVGDIIFWEGGEGTLPNAVKITSIEGDRFTCETPSIEEVYSSLELYGTFDGNIISATSASDGVDASYADDLYEEYKVYGMNCRKGEYGDFQFANSVKATKNYGDVTWTANLGENGTVTVGIKDISISASYQHGLTVLSPKEVSFRLNYSEFVNVHLADSYSKTIPLGEMDVQLGNTPFLVRFKVVAVIGANGELTLDFISQNAVGAKWKKGAGISEIRENKTSCDMQAEVTLSAEASALVDLRVGFLGASVSVVNAKATSGLVAIANADVDFLGNLPACVDVLMYVPLRFGLNQESCLLTDIPIIGKKLRLSAEIWNSTNSPFRWHWHFEDGERTPDDICTRNGEKIEQKEVDSAGNPFDEFEIFEFEPIAFDFIRLKETIMILNKGESANILIDSLPEGYEQSNLVYTPENGNVCSVMNGAVFGENAGGTTVKVSTSDGLFSAYITVLVNEPISDGSFDGL